MSITSISRKYSTEEIEQQKRYLSKARGLTESEKQAISEKLDIADVDTGLFSWVKCPVWRFRMYAVAEKKVIDPETLNNVMKYILEGEQ